MERIEILKGAAKDLGLRVEITSSGEGVARYKFIKPPFSFSNRGIYIAFGIKEAEIWLKGYEAGFHTRTSVELPSPLRLGQSI